jgi:hypothetical protein
MKAEKFSKAFPIVTTRERSQCEQEHRFSTGARFAYSVVWRTLRGL